jgi:membrane associated rhomboid family serine protease
MIDRAGPAANAARNFRLLASSRATPAVAGAVLLIHLPIAAAAVGIGFYETFGLSREGFLTGKIWQVLTHAALHGAWWHVALNALFVLLIGSRVEHVAGAAVTLRVLLAGVLGGAVIHLLLGSGLLVGLSGGCMALLLVLTTLSPHSRMMPLPVSGRSLGMGIILAALIFTLLNPALELPALSDAGRWLVVKGHGQWFQMGHACHLGGALSGWLYGRWILRKRVTLEQLRRKRARRGDR